jgi:hypothetical protein
MQKSQEESVHDDAARLLRRYAKNLPKLTAERRRRIVSAVAADLEKKHAAPALKKPRARKAA